MEAEYQQWYAPGSRHWRVVDSTPFMPNQTTVSNREDETYTVGARCVECRDQHPLHDRSYNGVTTLCPHCGSTQYSTVYTGEQITKPDAERITDAVKDIRGVGKETRQNIVSYFDAYYEFDAASVEDLTDIPRVGPGTAQRIVDRD